jgi:catechol 2,3-dioxygenase-like lactoylglutathione lyase family enzyme
MPDTTVGFDHVHLVSQDPLAAANWYVDRLGGKIVRSVEMKGAPQVYISFGEAMVLIRGQRPDEEAGGKSGLEWGLDHFGLRVRGDFNSFCAGLRQKGVAFSMEPTDINAMTRIAFIEAPDGVSIELLDRKDQQ